jgi:hypothetical protein
MVPSLFLVLSLCRDRIGTGRQNQYGGKVPRGKRLIVEIRAIATPADVKQMLAMSA